MNWRRYRDWGGWYPPSPPKRPPPKQGIAVKKFGATWWGQRWIEALERMSREYSNRLARGRTYARAGRVHDLKIAGGKVTAQVTGSRLYRVEIRIAALRDATWSKAIEAMAAKAAFAAQLLAGAMPPGIDETFEVANSSLFPGADDDIKTSCSCPDWANPCKHVAAVHYVLGEAFDRDPFLLFELRGRKKDQVLAALRRARAGGAQETDEAQPRQVRRSAAAPAADAAKSRGSRRSAAPAVRKAQVEPPDSNTHAIPAVALEVTASAEGYERPRAAPGALRFRIEAPTSHAAILRQLGAPPSWSAEIAMFERLAPVYEAAGRLARELALAADAFGPRAEPAVPASRARNRSN